MDKKERKNKEFIKFGLTLRNYRTVSGLSQEELAYKTGLDRTYISGIERGIRNVSLRNILLISNALKIQPYLLFIDNENVKRN